MYRFYFRLNFVVLMLAFLSFCTVSTGLNNGSGRGRSQYKSDSSKPVYNGLGYANGDYQMKQASAAKTHESKPRRGVGLSAWGIIAVLGGSILLGTALYYTVLFYPILCKKERKYDIMELTSV